MYFKFISFIRNFLQTRQGNEFVPSLQEGKQEEGQIQDQNKGRGGVIAYEITSKICQWIRLNSLC